MNELSVIDAEVIEGQVVGPATDPIGTVRTRELHNAQDFYVKIGENRWVAIYVDGVTLVAGGSGTWVSDHLVSAKPILRA